jgi:cobalt-zinc-cadmium efflux system protein
MPPGHDHDHDHDHAHDHDHDHAHGHDHVHHDDVAHAKPKSAAAQQREAKQERRLRMVFGLVAVFFVLEFAGASIAGSKVLRADALHLLMDVLALGTSLFAMRLAARRPTTRFTFGLRRAEPVAALFNAVLVLGATVEIIRDGIEDLGGTDRPRADIMLYVACAALVVNGLSAWLIHGAMHHSHVHGHDHDHAHGHDHGPKSKAPAKKAHGHALNLRGAMLHLVGDTLGSLAALTAAIVIRAGGSARIDPIASFLVAAILIAGALRLIRDAVLVLLEAAPVHLPVGVVRELVRGFPGVAEVHDLHVWTLGAGHDAIIVHVHADTADATLSSRLSARLREVFEVEYVTVQVELTAEACGAPPSRYLET